MCLHPVSDSDQSQKLVESQLDQDPSYDFFMKFKAVVFGQNPANKQRRRSLKSVPVGRGGGGGGDDLIDPQGIEKNINN